MPAWCLTLKQTFKFNVIALTEAGQSFRKQDSPTIKNIKKAGNWNIPQKTMLVKVKYPCSFSCLLFISLIL